MIACCGESQRSRWIDGNADPSCLARLPGDERLHLDDCAVVSREESLWDITLPEGGRDWLWDLAPRPEMYFHLDVQHRVSGYANFPRRAWLEGMHFRA